MLDEFDIEELVRGMHDLSDDVDVCDYVGEKYQIPWGEFCELIEALMPLIVTGQSPLTKKMYSGFGRDGVFFIKQEIAGQVTTNQTEIKESGSE